MPGLSYGTAQMKLNAREHRTPSASSLPVGASILYSQVRALKLSVGVYALLTSASKLLTSASKLLTSASKFLASKR